MNTHRIVLRATEEVKDFSSILNREWIATLKLLSMEGNLTDTCRLKLLENWKRTLSRIQRSCIEPYDQRSHIKDDEKKDTFYILWEPTSSLPPKIRFSTRDEAIRVAAKMAKQYNKRFYVMEAEAFAEASEVKVTII